MSEKKNSKPISRREFMKSVGVASAAALLSACQPKEVIKTVEKEVTAVPTPKGTVKLKMFNPMDPAVYTPWGNEKVKAAYPNIDLEVIYDVGGGGGWEGIADGLLTMLASGDTVDIIGMATEGVAIMATTGILGDLGMFLDADPTAKADFMEDMHPTLIKWMQWDNVQYLLPYGWNNMIVYYNTKVFESLKVPPPEKGWDWEDFLSVCGAVADVKGTEQDRFAYVIPGGGSFGMHAWFHNNDTSVLKNNWQDSNLDDPKVAETLQFLADMVLKHKYSPSPAGFNTQANFITGNTVMMSCGGWCLGGLISQKFYDYNFEYYPHKAGPLKTVIGIGGYAIAKITEYPEEAWNALKVILSKEGQLQYTLVDGSPPARRSVAAMPEFNDKAKPAPANMAIFYESLDSAAVVPAPSNANIIMPIIDRYYSQVWTGEISVDEAVQAMHTEVQAEMDKLKGT